MPDPPARASAPDMAELDDRWTARYVRILAAPVSRVWEAVTRAEALNLWFVPVVEIEPRVGGRCTFSWGRSRAEREPWTVSCFEPLRVFEVRSDRDSDQFIRFELEMMDASTRLTFVNGFPRAVSEADLELARANPGNKLLALPAGLDTPIRAGILEGYHLALDGLGAHVTRDFAAGELEASSRRAIEGVEASRSERFPNRDVEPSALARAYFSLLRATRS